MNRMGLIAAAAAALIATPALADSSASASLGPITVTLYQLGVTPASIVFTPSGYGNDTAAWVYAYDSAAVNYQYNDGFGTAPWDPTTAAFASTALSTGTASLTGSTAPNATGAMLSASGSATTPTLGSLYTDYAYSGSYVQASYGSTTFTLSPMTLVVLSGAAAIYGSANTASVYYDYAAANVNMQLSGTGVSGTGSQSSSDSRIGSVISYPGNGLQSFADSGTLTVSFLNLTPVSMIGTYAVTVDAVGFAYSSTPIPEPQTYALLLAGLGAVGFVARRRRA